MAEFLAYKPAEMATQSERETSAVYHLINLIKSTDAHILAYLWIAIESNYNIIILDKDKTAGRFINQLSLFVPRYHTVLDFTVDNTHISRVNFLKMVHEDAPNGMLFALMPKVFSLRKQKTMLIKAISSVMPDRVLCSSSTHIGTLFEYSKFGVSFMASITGNFRGRSMVRTLTKDFGIKNADMNALDITVTFDDSGIAAITEYRWIENAEVIAIAEHFIPKSVYNERIAFNNSIDPNKILESKVIENYAKSNLVSKDYAVKELKKRADYLERAVINNNTGQDFIERYYEIR